MGVIEKALLLMQCLLIAWCFSCQARTFGVTELLSGSNSGFSKNTDAMPLEKPPCRSMVGDG